MTSLLIGSFGVGLLLVAFVLNVLKRLGESSPVYLIMNIVGAGLSCWYAWVSGIVPFVILVGVWAGAALARFMGLVVTKTGSPGAREPV